MPINHEVIASGRNKWFISNYKIVYMNVNDIYAVVQRIKKFKRNESVEESRNKHLLLKIACDK